MQRREFYFLYVNVNSLVELALRQMAAKVLAQPPEVSVPEELSQEERDAQVMAGFENLDFSALDAVDLSSATPDMEEALPEPSVFHASDQVAGDDEAIDIESYLARAYGCEEQLRERIDDHYRRADLAALNSALLQLPAHLRPLTGPLSATDMENWLGLYGEGNAALIDLATQVRRLTTG